MTSTFACVRCGGFLGSAKTGGVRTCTACGAAHGRDGALLETNAPPAPVVPPTPAAPKVDAAPSSSTGPEPAVAIRTTQAALQDRALLARSGPGFLGVVAVLALAGAAVVSAFVGVSALVPTVGDEEPIERGGEGAAVADARADVAEAVVEVGGEASGEAAATWLPPTFVWTADRPASQGHIYAVGWLTNPNDRAMMSPKVVLQYRDGAGELLRDDFAYPFRLTLRPQERVPVSLLFDAVPAAASRTWVTSGSQAFASSPPAVEGLRVEGLKVEDPEYGLPEASGRVVHGGRDPADRVLVELLSYDRKDVLIGVDQAYVAADTLRPGESSHFSILLTSLGAPVARREARASATVATPPAPP